MRTYTITKTAYKFEELSESAKDNFRFSQEFYWSEDYLNTIKKGLEYFNCKIVDYSIHWFVFNSCCIKILCDFYELDEEDIQHINDSINELMDQIDNYPLTGFCADYDFIKSLRTVDSLDDLESMLKNASIQVIKAGCEDYNYQLTDEAIIEQCEANNYEFESNGELI